MKSDDKPLFSTKWYNEPVLRFGQNALCTDPKVGLSLNGPADIGTPRHRREIHVGIIGLNETIERTIEFLQHLAKGVCSPGDPDPFPGFTADLGFRSELLFSDRIQEIITSRELAEVSAPRLKRDKFTALLALLENKLRLLTEKDHPLDYVIVLIPTNIFTDLRVVRYQDERTGLTVHRDLRRAFKAIAMRYGKATQILKESTVSVEGAKNLQPPSTIAWNLFTALYFKSEGLAWAPFELAPLTCYVGISFYKQSQLESDLLQTSAVQAFDDQGDGLVLRGHSFRWNEKQQGRTPHLTEEMCGQLMQDVLRRYQAERKVMPKRVVAFKTSEFDAAEMNGCREALKSVDQYDLVTLRPSSGLRLLRQGIYPVLRGTQVSLGKTELLYTTGFLPDLSQYPHGHVPSPLLVNLAAGDSAKSLLYREILTLTKLNWNAAAHSGLMPITLRFSQTVADILKEVQPDQVPSAKFKFYM